jgi:hypothetical protein
VKLNITIACESPEEAAEVLAKLSGAPATKPTKSAPKEAKTEKPKPEANHTMDEIIAVATELCNASKAGELKKLCTEFGIAKISACPVEKIDALYERLETLNAV